MNETPWIDILARIRGPEYAVHMLELVSATRLGNEEVARRSIKDVVEGADREIPLAWTRGRIDEAVEKFGKQILGDVDASTLENAVGPEWTGLLGVTPQGAEVAECLVRDGYKGKTALLGDLAGLLATDEQ